MAAPKIFDTSESFDSDLRLDQQIATLLYKTSNRTSRLMGRALVRHGLTFPQYQVLIALMDLGQSSIGKLCGALEIDASTVTSVLKRLEAQNYVLRFRDRIDERRVYAALTDKGLAFKPVAQDLRRGFLRHLGFTPEEATHLRDALHHLSKAIGRKDH